MKTLRITCTDGVFVCDDAYIQNLCNLYSHEFVLDQLAKIARWTVDKSPRWKLESVDKQVRRWLITQWDANVIIGAHHAGDIAWRLHGFASIEDYRSAIADGPGPGLTHARWLEFKSDQYRFHFGDDTNPHWLAIVEAKRSQLERYHQAILGKDWRSKLARYEADEQA